MKSRYFCARDKKGVSKNKAFAECLVKNNGKEICGHLIINLTYKRKRR